MGLEVLLRGTVCLLREDILKQTALLGPSGGNVWKTYRPTELGPSSSASIGLDAWERKLSLGLRLMSSHRGAPLMGDTVKTLIGSSIITNIKS